jgi:hypothetical protein
MLIWIYTHVLTSYMSLGYIDTCSAHLYPGEMATVSEHIPTVTLPGEAGEAG